MQAVNTTNETDYASIWQGSVSNIAWGTLFLFACIIFAYVFVVTYTLVGQVSYPVATLICSYLAFASFTVMHDAGHGSIFKMGSRFKPIESLIGWIASIPMVIVPYRIFQKIHDRHHAFTNDPERDPDYIPEQKTWFRLLLSLYYTPIKYHVMSLTSLRKIKVIRNTYASSIAYMIGLYGVLIALAVNGYVLEVMCFALIPVGVALFFLVMFFDYVPHHPHKSLGRYQNTRIFEGRVLNVLLLGQNYHLIHHLYPRLPWYQYEGVYKNILPELERNGAPIESVGSGERARFMQSPMANKLQHNADPIHKLLKVSNIEHITADALAVSFELPLGETLEYKSGQYIMLSKWLAGEQQTRCYSLCSAPNKGLLKIAVKQTPDGLVSKYMKQTLQVGDELIIQGPFGDFIYPPAHENKIDNLVLLSGGSGITPLLSILETALRDKSIDHIYLIYTCRDVRSIMFFEHLKALKDEYSDRFHLNFVITDNIRKEYSSSQLGFDEVTEFVLEKTGRLDKDMLVSLLPWLSIGSEVATSVNAIDNTEYYICGPEGLKNTVIESLGFFQVDPERVHVEQFITMITKPEGKMHSVDITLAGGQQHTLNVASNQNVLEVAKIEGVKLPHACGNGTCGSCKLKVSSGEVVEIPDLVPGILVNEKAAGYTLACQCRPLSNISLSENLN